MAHRIGSNRIGPARFGIPSRERLWAKPTESGPRRRGPSSKQAERVPRPPAESTKEADLSRSSLFVVVVVSRCCCCDEKIIINPAGPPTFRLPTACWPSPSGRHKRRRPLQTVSGDGGDDDDEDNNNGDHLRAAPRGHNCKSCRDAPSTGGSNRRQQRTGQWLWWWWPLSQRDRQLETCLPLGATVWNASGERRQPAASETKPRE